MKKLIFILFLIFLFTIDIVFALPNPAATYCKDLGYNYTTVKTSQGENGECVFPNNQKCDEWDFLKGKCGRDYSYCKKNGYDIKTKTDGKNSYSSEYAVCVPKTNDQKETAVTDFINLNEELSTNSVTEKNSKMETAEAMASITSLPSYFDWRNKDGKNWMTPVKDQGWCGSCWDFGAVGTIEAKIKIQNNVSEFNPDLSEQDVLSCSNAGSCNGGWSDGALDYANYTGVVDEQCFPYAYRDDPCSNICSDWANRKFKIAGWWFVPYDADIKSYLIEKGPLTTYIAMTGYFDEKGIYKCDIASQNHAVVLVGYNDTGGYWIIKNSWGVYWGDNGYFKIYYGNCSVDPIAYVYTQCDKISPDSITDLSVINSTTTKITLQWTTTGDNGRTGSPYYYEIAYSTEPITESNYNSRNKTTYYNSTLAGIKTERTVNYLLPNTTYYLAIKAYDNCGNPSNISNIVSGSTKPPKTPPNPITDLSVINSTTTKITLQLTTNAPHYDLRYSTSPINEGNFNSVDKALWCNFDVPSQIKKCEAMGLFPETTYYFAIKVYDDLEYPNLSNISNIVSGLTKPPKVVLFSDNVENGNKGWTTSFLTNNISKLIGTPLWHISSHRYSSLTHSWYYGIENQWNYNTGSANNGSLISPVFYISNYSALYFILKYSTDLEPQGINRWQDDFTLTHWVDGFPMQRGVWFENRSTKGEFIKKMFSLDSWGKTLQISFDFNSVDELYNDYEGIYLDDIQVIADNYKPVANANGPYFGRVNENITFNGSKSYDLDGDSLTYSWSFGDGNYDYGKIAIHKYKKPGIYNVSLLVNDDSPQSEYSYTTVNVASSCSGNISLSLSPNPVDPSTNVTATISGLNNCDGKTASILKYISNACRCTVSDSDCSCTFKSPSSLGSYKYTAYIDKNGDGDTSDPGESYETYLTVAVTGGGGGRTRLLSLTGNPLIIILLVAIIVLVIIFGVFKLFTKR